MKKICLGIFLLLLLAQNSVFAINIGAYKPETEYGLIDGFKFNFGRKNKDEKFIQIKSETPEEILRLEREKTKQKPDVDNEYEIFRFMQQNTVPF